MSRIEDKDSLGSRMKRYEEVSKSILPIRSYVIIRIDGCHFHTYTKGFRKPFDNGILNAMRKATEYVANNIQGCKFAYTQSDEASFLLTDFEELNTSAWFDNQVQKIVSVSASLFTAKFNQEITNSLIKTSSLATFDSRVFALPNKTEVMNYFLWRIKDAERNSLAGLCQSLYSHKQLAGKKAKDQQELLFQKGINWNDFDESLKRGTIFLVKENMKIAAPRNKEDLLKFIPTVKEYEDVTSSITKWPVNFMDLEVLDT